MKGKRLLYIYEGAPALYQSWQRGNDPATHLFGVPHLEELGWVVTIRDHMEFRGFFGLVRFLCVVRKHDVVLTLLHIPWLLLPRWLRSCVPWAVIIMDTVSAYERMRGRLKRWLFLRALGRADLLLPLADFQKDYFIAQKIPAEKFVVVPLGSDPDFYARETAEPSPEPFIFAVGRDLGRDFNTLVEASRDLGTKVVIATSRKIIATLSSLPPNVEVRENTPILVTRALIKQSLAVVIPSHPRGGSDCSGQTVLLEAWASKKPVIVSGREWVRTYVEAGRDAIVVPPEDVSALREALQMICLDEKARERLGKAGHARLLQHFTWRITGAQLATALEKLCAA